MERRCVFIRKKKVKLALWMVAGIAVFAGTVTTTRAYLTNTTGNLKNILTPGTVTAELKESDWKEDAGAAMLPAESRNKNPVVKNTGTIDAWMFLEMEIPIREIAIVDAQTRRKLPEKRTELVQFTVNEGWELLEKYEKEETMHYIYGYQELVAPFQETVSLFDKITIVSYLEGSLDEKEIFQIPVKAKAIQKNIAPEGSGLRELYQIYLEQKETEGR